MWVLFVRVHDANVGVGCWSERAKDVTGFAVDDERRYDVCARGRKFCALGVYRSDFFEGSRVRRPHRIDGACLDLVVIVRCGDWKYCAGRNGFNKR
jgi:hypothetical protein